MITASGRIRHSVYFIMIDSEWPAVKARLEAKLNSRKHRRYTVGVLPYLLRNGWPDGQRPSVAN